jgi:tRNA threonylcarbamoyladenosine biosynthesis protein TsaB
MNILTIRTDKPLSEVALFNDSQKIDEIKWEAYRSLADTIHTKIEQLLKSNKLDWQDIGGLACYKGPGSFTGLRIGLSVANALSYILKCPIISQTGKDWQSKGIKRLLRGENEKITLPEYDSEAKITKPKK